MKEDNPVISQGRATPPPPPLPFGSLFRWGPEGPDLVEGVHAKGAVRFWCGC